MTSGKQTIDYYDVEADVYDSVRYGGRKGRLVDGFHKRVLSEQLLQHLAPEARVIEIGCGTGRLTRHVLDTGINVTGLDISSGMLRVARQRLRGNKVSLLSGSLDSLPFAADEFDAAYAILVLNLIPDLNGSLVELARVIKPGGHLLFNLPNLSSMYFAGGLYVNLRGKTVTRNQAGYRYSHWYHPGKVANMLDDAGFELLSIRPQPLFFAAGSGKSVADLLVSRYTAKSLYYTARLKG